MLVPSQGLGRAALERSRASSFQVDQVPIRSREGQSQAAPERWPQCARVHPEILRVVFKPLKQRWFRILSTFSDGRSFGISKGSARRPGATRHRAPPPRTEKLRERRLAHRFQWGSSPAREREERSRYPLLPYEIRSAQLPGAIKGGTVAAARHTLDGEHGWVRIGGEGKDITQYKRGFPSGSQGIHRGGQSKAPPKRAGRYVRSAFVAKEGIDNGGAEW